jgi:hypothetical protein
MQTHDDKSNGGPIIDDKPPVIPREPVQERFPSPPGIGIEPHPWADVSAPPGKVEPRPW